jgi:hypothetical protein
MLGKQGNSFNRFQRLWQGIKNQLIQAVPEKDAVCEFDCGKGNCTVGEWKTCERRIQKTAGELRRSERSPETGHPPRAA